MKRDTQGLNLRERLGERALRESSEGGKDLEPEREADERGRF